MLTATHTANTAVTATLDVTPNSRTGSAYVYLDRDPGIGPMNYPDALTSWQVTGGDPASLVAAVAWADRQIDSAWGSSDAPGAVWLRHWRAQVAGLLAAA